MSAPFTILPKLLGQDGAEFKFPIMFWYYDWPKTSQDNGLLFLRNSFFYRFHNTSWHSIRHFPQFHTLKHRVMKAVCERDTQELKRCLEEGWRNSINDVVDHEGKYSALSLACYLDNLDAVHLLDLYGANLSAPVGKFGNTALMSSVTKWNVRIIDYLLERGVDPSITDKYGFTAKRKAEIKQLRTI